MLEGIQKILSGPLVLARFILANIYQDAFLIFDSASAGRAVSAAAVVSLLRWGALALLILILIGWVCVDTVKRALFAESKERNVRTLLFNAIFIFLALFFYYSIISVAVHVFFFFILPISREL